jgi:hypothetical protein
VESPGAGASVLADGGYRVNYFMEGHHASPNIFTGMANDRRDDLGVGNSADPPDYRRTDPLNAARGVVYGTIISVVFWLIAFAVVLLVRGW